MSRPLFLLLRSVALALVGAAVSAEAQAPVDLRIALVIGNAAYAAAPLANPGNDARAMRDALQGMGFTVIEARDASKAQMQAAITRAGTALKGHRGIGMLYYAGHGLQLDWRNYMVPVDARINSAAEVSAQAVDVQAVIDAFKAAGNRINIVVLDACRDNPFAATASGKGLAQMDAPPGTLLAYATAPGNVAEDGDAKSGNGLYTQFLVKELAQPAAKIEDVFKRVRLQVRMQSQGRQIPWESTSLEDDFYFDVKAKPAALSEADDAQQRKLELEGWVRIAESMRAADFSDYLLQFPNGHYAELAQFKLDQLATPQVVAAPDRSGRVAPAPGALRYRVGDVYTYNFYENFGARKQLAVSRREVTFADDHKVLLNNGQWEFDQMGMEIRDSYGHKSPGLIRAPADLALGKKWRSAYDTGGADGLAHHFTLDHAAVARERITVPAGSFDTYRIDTRGVGVGDGGFYLQVNMFVWVDAQGLFVVKNEWKFSGRKGTVANLGIELSDLKRMPR